MADKLDIDAIRAGSDIVNIVSNYLTITQKGKNHLAVCPFHNDTNPSLSISSEKQIYKCFVCNKGGNVFTFVQDYEKIGFIDAVIKVAELSHIEISDSLKKEKIIDPIVVRLKEAVKFANDFYTYSLQNSSEDSEIWNYLKSRGINKEIAKDFNLGYATNKSNVLVQILMNKGFTEQELLDAGLAFEANQEIRDRFRNRLLFAIADESGDIVGFSGRALVKEGEPKYINSPESKIFKKNQILYNYHIAKGNYYKDNQIYIVEGFMDTIGLYKIGIRNVVATMGTAFSNEHFKLLKRLNTTIILALDTDNAGQVATTKILDSSKNLKLDIKVVDSDIDKDADEILEEDGEESLKNYLAKTLTPIEFYFKIFTKRYNIDNYQEKKTIIRELSKRLANLDAIDIEYYSKKLAQISKISLETIREEILDNRLSDTKYLNKENSRIKNEFISRKSKNEDKFDVMQKQLLYYMITSKEALEIISQKNLVFTNDNLRALHTYINYYFENNKDILVADIISKLPNRELVELITEIYDSDLSKQFDISYIENYIKLTEIEGEVKEIDLKTQELLSSSVTDNLEEISKLFEQRTKLIKEYDMIKSKTAD